MAKIKDCVVISEELLNRIIRRLDKCGCENLSLELENSSKPLEPIVRDAYDAGYDPCKDIEGYLNETEL